MRPTGRLVQRIRFSLSQIVPSMLFSKCREVTRVRVPDRQGGEVNKVDKGPGKCGWMQAGSGLRRNVNLVDSVNFVYVDNDAAMN